MALAHLSDLVTPHSFPIPRSTLRAHEANPNLAGSTLSSCTSRCKIPPSSSPRRPLSSSPAPSNGEPAVPGKYKLLPRADALGFPVAQEISASADLAMELPTLNRNLYSHVEPYSSGFLKVSELHTLYWEQSGNPNGHPVVFIHGGPGAGTSPNNRQFFDPKFYRIILFDQRGAGKSTPHACLEENTTWDLVEDIEKLRQHLEIPEWQVKIVTIASMSFLMVEPNIFISEKHCSCLVGHGEAHWLLRTAKFTLIK
uniref:prolyl aminopeptidase n=1 Tax=Anthurium amnicola TaxID=1678845 RepID=A0A1D1XHZ1_9ARAE